jgi:hypothetical protein
MKGYSYRLRHQLRSCRDESDDSKPAKALADLEGLLGRSKPANVPTGSDKLSAGSKPANVLTGSRGERTGSKPAKAPTGSVQKQNLGK